LVVVAVAAEVRQQALERIPVGLQFRHERLQGLDAGLHRLLVALGPGLAKGQQDKHNGETRDLGDEGTVLDSIHDSILPFQADATCARPDVRALLSLDRVAVIGCRPIRGENGPI
jgi:hypothetical protein